MSKTSKFRRRARLTTALAGGALVATMAMLGGASAATGDPAATGDTKATGDTTAPLQDYPDPNPVTGDTGVHDPTVAKTPDGTYLMAHTGDNIVLKTSPDRTEWTEAGVAFPDGAPWTSEYTDGGASLWAPDISYRDGQYFMYYSASTFGSQHSAIFLATSPTGESGTWTDQGMVIESSEAVDYNAIDPNLIVDADGNWWLSFGSYWTGIKMISLDPATGLPSSSDTEIRSLADRSSTGTSAVEAPFIFQRGGYYYLFVSFDVCCQGADSTYRIMVGRSESITGPYVDQNGTEMTAGGGTEILAGHGSFHGTGHQAVLADDDADVLFYHYYADDDTSLLGINSLAWDDAGWPVVQ